MAHALLGGVLARFGDQFRVQVDAHAAHAELFRRLDHDPPVAAAHIIENISLLDLGDVKHPLHDMRRRRYERDRLLRQHRTAAG